MDFFGVFLFSSAMVLLICLAVAVRAQILCRNEIYAYQQQAIVVMKENLDTAERERATLKCELVRTNQAVADMTGELSIVTRERNDAVDELGKVTKERDELQAKVCELKTNDIELLNLRIYKESMLARLKAIINDEVDE